MKNTTSLFAVTYGLLDFFAEEGLRTLFLSTADEVRELAEEFITVIPDDLDDYRSDIQDWNGKDRLLIRHQDDDTFYFSAVQVPTSPTMDFSDFHDFVRDYAVEGD